MITIQHRDFIPLLRTKEDNWTHMQTILDSIELIQEQCKLYHIMENS